MTMKRIRLFASCAICTLLFAAEALAQTAPPPQITIDDLLDGNPVVHYSGGVSALTAITDEFAQSISGTLSANPASFSGAVVLSEPPQDPAFILDRFSDLLTLTVTQCVPTPAQGCDQGASFQFVFESDGATNFDLDVENALKNPSTVTILETGAFQDLIGPAGAFPYAGLDIQVRSDFANPEVPEPATLVLLAIAFAGLGWARQRMLH
jgi:hypothetical protein